MISIIIPILNERANIRPLYYEIKNVIENTMRTEYEIIYIDDGSTDDGFEVLEELHEKDNNVKAIQFRRHLGKSMALSAGFKKAIGDVVLTMDGDLQDDPKEIPRLVGELSTGYDLVVGWKHERHDPLTKRLPSKVFNKLTNLLTGVNVHDNNCCFKAFKKEVVENINVYGELHRYIPAIAHQKGYRVTEIKVNHRPRRYGKTKYGVMRLLSGFLDLITVSFLTNYSKKPLHLFGVVGLMTSLVGGLVGIYLFYVKYVMNQLIGHRPLLFASILLIIVGIQMISLGLLGEMITANNMNTSTIVPESEVRNELI